MAKSYHELRRQYFIPVRINGTITSTYNLKIWNKITVRWMQCLACLRITMACRMLFKNLVEKNNWRRKLENNALHPFARENPFVRWKGECSRDFYCVRCNLKKNYLHRSLFLCELLRQKARLNSPRNCISSSRFPRLWDKSLYGILWNVWNFLTPREGRPFRREAFKNLLPRVWTNRYLSLNFSRYFVRCPRRKKLPFDLYSLR